MRGEFVEVGGERLYYYAAGTRGLGPPVVFLHGFPTSSRLWHGVVRDFPAGHRLVVLDLPGYGRSDASLASAEHGHAGAIIALLDELRIERACLVGHGLGGAVAQALAHRAAARVSHLLLVSSCAHGAPPRRFASLARALLPIARHLSPALLAGLVHAGVRRGFADPEGSRLTLDTVLHPFTTARGRSLLIEHLAAIGREPDALPLGRLAELALPIAILWGNDDPFLPVSVAEQLHAALAHSTLAVVPGARHFVPEDAPHAVLGAILALLRR